MSHVTLQTSLIFILLQTSSPHPHNYHHLQPILPNHQTPYKFHLTFKPPPRRISSQPPPPQIPQTPAEDRFFDDLISQPASIVPKLFGDKPFWVPHAYFNLCPFVRGPDIDPVWSAGCAPLPYPQMSNYSPQNVQATYARLQALQQEQEEQAKREQEEPYWWEQYLPSGPTDFGMANMYGPVQQQEMYNYYDYNGGGVSGGGGGESATARGGIGKQATRPRNSAGMFWGGGAGSGGFWG